MSTLREWVDAALTVADTEGMADGQIIPTWPSDVAGFYPTLTIGALREWKAAYGHDQVDYRAVATRAIGDIAKITELLGVSEEEAGRPIVELAREFLSARTQAPASGEVEPDSYVCHSCGSKVSPPAPFSLSVYCRCGHSTAATIAADLAKKAHPPAKVPEGELTVSAEWLKGVRRDLDACQKVIWMALRGDCDPAYCRDAQARLKEIDALLTTPTTAATQPAQQRGAPDEDALIDWAEQTIERLDPHGTGMVYSELAQAAKELFQTPQPEGDGWGEIQELANKVCGHAPQGWIISLCMENGAAWVEATTPDGNEVQFPDHGDMSLVEQINDALCTAKGWTQPPTQKEGE